MGCAEAEALTALNAGLCGTDEPGVGVAGRPIFAGFKWEEVEGGGSIGVRLRAVRSRTAVKPSLRGGLWCSSSVSLSARLV
jgi:hypothetical protein